MSSGAGEPLNPRFRFGRPDPKDQNMPAEQRLLQAAACLVFEEGTDLLAEALLPAAVATRAGMARASYYRAEFGGAAGSDVSRREILEMAISRILVGSAADLEQVVGTIAEHIEAGWVSESPNDLIRSVSSGNFATMATIESMAQLLAAALAPSSPELGQSLGNYYTTVTDAYVSAYDQLLRHWRYRIRPPFTTRTLTVTLMALAEGLWIRYCGDDGVDQELFSEILAEIATLLLVADGDVAETQVPVEHFLPGSKRPPTRSDIIAALRRLYAGERLDMASLAEIASAAGCSESVIKEHFGGVRGLIHAAWAEWIPEFAEEVERERARMRDPDPLGILYRVAQSIALRAFEEPGLSRALLMSDLALSGPAASLVQDPVTDLFAKLLREAVDRGVFVPPGASGWHDIEGRIITFATLLRHNLLGAVVAVASLRSDAGGEQACRCVDYVWAVVFPSRAGSPG